VLPVDLDAPAEEIVAAAVSELARDRLLIYPTETLYAIGGRALEPGVGARVREAKGRPDGQPLPLIAADVDQARRLFEAWPEPAARLAERFWPGPLTLVLAADSDVPREVIGGGDTVGVRVPGRELPRRLCRAAGPLIATSANRSGQPPATRCADAVAAIGAWAALALDGGTCAGAPSTIVDLVGRAPRIVREGAIPAAEVLAWLR
jgi:L-threonylcarbamoyladenylate synthase